MGTMHYAGVTVEFDDRTLTHLQIMIVQRFRCGEAFPMSWVDSTAVGNGRSAVWLTPSTPVFFKFDGSRVPTVDRAWLDRLTASADSPRGLIVTDTEGGLVEATANSHHTAPQAMH